MRVAGHSTDTSIWFRVVFETPPNFYYIQVRGSAGMRAIYLYKAVARDAEPEGVRLAMRK
ncbi:TPA: hypothetical protein EYP44_04285 [Candidatus Bathyarchaeota archaeon]|nr:hypothetical protein [Candidatus Bathyarchaeota archaeon]